MRSVWILAVFLCLIIQTTIPSPLVSNSTDCDPPNMKCQTGECIPKERICDGMFDCFEGEDEMNCTSSTEEKCKSGYSKCSTEDLCVPNAFLCDGDEDCPDGSDEASCEDQQSDYSCSASDSFVCKTTKENQQKVCLSQNSTCNGIKECPLGDDEENCEDLRGCAVQEHKCHHFCEDRPGSFVCGCAEGYKLESDGRSCRYENEKSSAGYLLVSHGPEIHQIPLANVYGDTNDIIVHNTQQNLVGAMDYMRQNDELFMIMMSSIIKQGSISTRWELGVLSNGRVKVLRENINGGDHVAVDWIGKNVFVTQGAMSSRPGISVCTMNGLFCRQIVEGRSKDQHYRGLIAHPTRGLILWLDYDLHVKLPPHIMMSNMDGSDVRSLIESSMGRYISAFAIDHIKNDVYFVNNAVDSVERINIETKEVHVVFSYEHRIFSTLVYLNGFLYWHEWLPNNDLMVQEVAHNHSSPHVAQKLKGFSFNIAANHSLHQIEPSLNPCHELDCPWLCIIIPKSSSGGITAKCICPDGYTPSGDTCIPFSPFDEMEILKNYSHIGFELMSEYCKKGIACKNGGSCRELLNETRIVCDCKPPFDGQYCERINPEKHAAMKELRAQFSVFAFLSIIVLVLLIIGCGAIVRMAKRKLKTTSSTSPLVNKLKKVIGKEEKASTRVNFVNGESGIRMENRPTTFNNPSFDEESNVSSVFSTSSSASFSTTIRFENDGSLL